MTRAGSKCFEKTYTKDDLGDLEPRLSESSIWISVEAFERSDSIIAHLVYSMVLPM